jgi:GMP synthase-like glutamine amidotransferase
VGGEGDHRLMQTYIGTKMIRARPMSRGEYNSFRGWEIPADEDPSDAGHLVEYLDGGKANVEGFAGYVSWSPADVFDKSYRPIVGLSFGDALAAMKIGQRVARAGWNGKGMFAYLVPAASYPVQTGAAKAHFGEGAMVPYRAYLALKTVDEDVATWAPSCSDVLADDWEILV